MYAVIHFSVDGDNYTIHSKLEEAKTSFAECIKYISDINSEDVVSLLSITEGEEFGFNSIGDVFGAEVIDTFEMPS